MTLAIDQLSADVNLLDRWHAERPSRSYVPGRAIDLEGRDFAGTPVFDLDALEKMRKHLTKGVNGFPVASGNGCPVKEAV